MLLDRRGGFADAGALFFERHVGLTLGVGAAMADDLVAVLAERRDHLRAVVVELAVDEQRVRQVVSLCELEQAPRADAVAVVAPGEAARVGLRMRRRVVVTEPIAEGHVLDVQAEVHRETLAAGPAVVLALGDGGVVVAAVALQFHLRRPPGQSVGIMLPAWISPSATARWPPPPRPCAATSASPAKRSSPWPIACQQARATSTPAAAMCFLAVSTAIVISSSSPAWGSCRPTTSTAARCRRRSAARPPSSRSRPSIAARR